MQFNGQEPPVAAATLMLTREDRGELEIYLLQRNKKSGFMGGNYVFPGGVLDPGDRDVARWQDHLDMDAKRIVARLGGQRTRQEIVAYGVAAIRETYEEAGVLLADRNGRRDQAMARFERYRGAQPTAQDWFGRNVRSGGWKLRFSSLYRWTRWITPKGMSRRFDTRFFIAPMPADQTCRPDGVETVNGIWISPKAGLAANLAAEIPLSPPTVVSLQQLVGFKSATELYNHARDRTWGSPLRPRLVPMEKGALILEPWDPQYGSSRISIAHRYQNRDRLAAGDPFSRLWFDGRIWQPVASGA